MIGKTLSKKYNYLLILFVFLIGFFLTLVMTSNSINIQDEAAVFFSSKYFVETGSFELENDLNKELNTNVFHPGYSFYELNGPIKFSSPIGTTILYALFYLRMGKSLIYLNALFVGLILTLLYLFSIKLFKKNEYALFCSTIILFMPILLRYGVSLYTILPAIFLIILSFYFSLFYMKNWKNVIFLISLLWNALFLIRFGEGIILFPVLVFIMYKGMAEFDKKIKRKAIFYFLAIFLFMFMIFQLPLSIGNSEGIISTPFVGGLPYVSTNESFNEIHLSETKEISNLNKWLAYPLGTKFGIKDFKFSEYSSKIIGNSKFIFSKQAFPFLWILLIGGGLLLFRNKSNEGDERDINTIVLAIILIFVVTLLFYGPRTNYYGFENLSVSSSIYRYFFLFFIMSSLTFPIFLSYLKKYNKKIQIIVVFLLVILYLVFFASYSINSKGFHYVNELKNNQKEYLSEISLLDGEKSVFIVGYHTDKYTYFLSEDTSYQRTINYYVGGDYYNTEMEKKLFDESKRVYSELIDKGYSVYFIESPFDKTSQDRYKVYLEDKFNFDVKIMEINNDRIIISQLYKK
jgi:hypothetical protein